MRIYTRTGDRGDTGLFGGGRVAKSNPRVAAYGDVDELNAVIGVAAEASEDAAIRDVLEELQPDLFAIGAHLATPPQVRGRRPSLPPLPSDRPAELEARIDAAEEELATLDAFVMPGGTRGAAALHHARTVARRAERSVVALAASEEVDPAVIVYLNRLSDLLFTLARQQNHRAGVADRKWLWRDPDG